MKKKSLQQNNPIKKERKKFISPNNEVIFTLTKGIETVELHFDYKGETIWATQNTIAELFETTKQNVSKHIKNIYETEELSAVATVNKKLTVQMEGERPIKRELEFYNLDVIIAVGYRVNSEIAIRFRQWATARLNEFIIKGFTLDDNRLKNHGSRYFEELFARIRDIRNSERNLYQKVTDIYATAINYDAKKNISKTFFATVQNKMHFAVTGKTAAEIIHERSNSKKINMGLTSFKGDYLIRSDAYIAKNYLNKEELKSLNLLVDAYLSFAEIQVSRRIAMRMEDWVKKLDEYLKFSSYDVLGHAGKISHEKALEKAEAEYQKFTKDRSGNFKSDFDSYLEIEEKTKDFMVAIDEHKSREKDSKKVKKKKQE